MEMPSAVPELENAEEDGRKGQCECYRGEKSGNLSVGMSNNDKW
jgi:hypothetical protein